jgi:hypothetical protein
MTDLYARIDGLDRVTAYEAAQLLAVELGADPDVRLVDHEALNEPLAHQDDFENLAKVLLLITADADPEAVERAIDGAGRKQLVLSGDELIALSVLIVGALQVLMSKGKAGEHVEIVIERDSNGQEKITTKKSIHYYRISVGVAGLLRSLAGASKEYD